MYLKPDGSGANPFLTLSCPVAVNVARVLPWNEPFVVIISPLPVYLRASFIAPSFASAPLLAKNTLSCGDFLTIFSAYFACSSV